jgi:glycosyltransferase involved in cell wall biosynthesis
MKTNFLTHVVPTLPPQNGGAGEYALDLACQLRDQHGINSQFILCDPNWDGPARIKNFVIRRLRFPNEAGLWGLLASIKDKPAVLLHYDGYGYHKHGAPAWLYLGIKSWLAERNRGSAQYHKQFSTVFHELWGPAAKPWQGKFYRQILQKRLIERLHRQSQISITSTHHRRTLLDAIDPEKTMLLPIPGSLPVVDRTMPGAMQETPLRVAILGQHAPRSETIRAHANLLRTLDKTNRLASVVLMGKGRQASESLKADVALLQKQISPKQIEVLEESGAEDVSMFLSRADLFLSPYGGEIACRSAAFMTALAAGCLAVSRDGHNTAPLQESEHFIASDDSPSSVERFERIAASGELQRIATAGQRWYQQYADWKVVAQKYQEAFQTRVPVELLEEPRLNLPLWSLPARPAH